MKTVKQILETTYMPKGGDEKKFWDKHVRKLFDHPVAEPTQFKASTKKSKTRPKDYDAESGDAVYEAAFNDTHVHTKRADKEPVISRGIDPVTRKGINIVKKGATGEIKIGEETELGESITSMSDERLKFYATKSVPHGSYTRKEIEAEHNRRKKTDGIAYALAKPTLNEDADLDEKVKNPYAIGMAAAMKQAGDTPPLKKSTIVKGHEIAKSIKKEALDPVGKADADIDNDGDVDKSDKYLHNRRKAIGKALANVSAKPKSQVSLKKAPWNEETDLNEETKSKNMIHIGHGDSYMDEPWSHAVYINGKKVVDHNKPGDFSMDGKVFKSVDGYIKALSKKYNVDPNSFDLYTLNDKTGKPESQPYVSRHKPRNLPSIGEGADVYEAKAKPGHNAMVMAKNLEKVKNAIKTEGAKESSEANHKKYIAGAKNKEEFKESADQLDELSPNTLHKYVKGAASSLAGNAAAAGAALGAGKLAPRDFTRWTKNRMKGIVSASGRLSDKANAVKEETEELDEAMSLDKVNKVHADSGAESFAKDYVKGNKGDYTDGGPTDKHVKDSDKFHSTYERVSGRSGFAGSGHDIYKHKTTGDKFRVDRHPNGKGFYGTDHMVSKLHEGTEELDEISRDLVRSYIRKAGADNAERKIDVMKPFPLKDMEKNVSAFNKMKSRQTGIETAGKKAYGIGGKARVNATEEVEQIDEAFKAGQMKLNDGSSVTLTRESAESLNSLFTQLSPANKTKMEERLMSSPKGYNEILSFAENING